jgi:hypothetical protein
VIAWRKDLDDRKLAAGSVRRKLSALASLYEYLTDQNAVPTNPVKGVKRPKVDSYEGKTPAIADKEARQLMQLPGDKSLKGLRDRALLATLLHHGLRRDEEVGALMQFRPAVRFVTPLTRIFPELRNKSVQVAAPRTIGQHPASASTEWTSIEERYARSLDCRNTDLLDRTPSGATSCNSRTAKKS